MSFEHLTYQELLEDYIKDYQREFGMRKYEKVYKNVYTSKKISNLIYLTRQRMLIPNKNDFLYSLNETLYFIFSKADTLALGGLLSLERWNIECNQTLRLANSYQLKDIAVGIIQDCLKTKL